MGGIANNPQFQNAMQMARSIGQMPQQPQQPGQVPQQGGDKAPPVMTLPDHYQSPFASYGFDPGLQSYLDQQMYRSYTDGGVGFQYDPTNQTFTGGTMGGRYNPIPLNVMQEAAGGNRDVLNPYYQPKYPQQPGYIPPQVKPGMDINQLKEMFQGQPQTQPMNPNQVYAGGNPNFDERTGTYINPQKPVPMPGRRIIDPVRPGYGYGQQPQAPQQRGLGGLQLNKFRNRLG
jgi:hypothetical protein